MPALRLLVVADARMLAALSGGLREGGRYEVTALPFADGAAVAAAAGQTDAAILFYGSAETPLPAALGSLASVLRPRARVVAVLHRDQAALRDDCFRAGASDVLFMPTPRPEFVARLQAALELSFPAAGDEGGRVAAVAVSTRAASLKLSDARIRPVGVEGAGALALQPGETVRIAWPGFNAWGLVVRGEAPARVRFAGLTAEEETALRNVAASGGAKPADGASAAPPPAAPAASPAEAPAPPPAAAPRPAEPVVRAAPLAGPPPGFADRKPVRPVAPSPRVAAAATGSAAPVLVPTPPDVAPAPTAVETLEPAAATVTADAPAALGPVWPDPAEDAACRAAALELLRGRTVPAETPPPVAASARKVCAVLGSAEREALEKGGAESHFADALAVRIALDTATSDGSRLFAAAPAAVVDAAAVAALTQRADAAAARLQKEANGAVARGEVETLQLVTAANAALSRDLFAFKETADRLRGIGAAPRLGAGALDPEIVVPGQARPRPAPAPVAPAPEKAELKQFAGLEEKGGGNRGKVIAVVVAAAVLIGTGTRAFLSLPQPHTITADAGANVVRIDVSGSSGYVVVNPAWLTHREQEVSRLCEVLRARHVDKAIVVLPNGKPVGNVDVFQGKLYGGTQPAAPAPATTKN